MSCVAIRGRHPVVPPQKRCRSLGDRDFDGAKPRRIHDEIERHMRQGAKGRDMLAQGTRLPRADVAGETGRDIGTDIEQREIGVDDIPHVEEVTANVDVADQQPRGLETGLDTRHLARKRTAGQNLRAAPPRYG